MNAIKFSTLSLFSGLLLGSLGLSLVPQSPSPAEMAPTPSVISVSTPVAQSTQSSTPILIAKIDFTQEVQTKSYIPSKSSYVSKSSILRSGSFVTTEQDHPTAGTATIIVKNGQRYLEFDSAFTTATGPDVNVLLYRSNSVPVKLAEKDYVKLAALKSTNGAQRYAIPENVDLDSFGAVAIWCQKFNVTFGYAKLS